MHKTTLVACSGDPSARGKPSLRGCLAPGRRRPDLSWTGWLVVLVLATLLAGCSREPRWNVVVVTLDTTRADHLGCYGHPEIRTPVIDALAAEGTLFAQAAAPVPITLPSHSSLMTGKVPFAHGVRDNGLFVLGEEQETLAEILQRAGYRTGAAVGAFPVSAQFGIDQGFEHFDDHLSRRYEDLYGQRIFPKERLFFDERPAARVNEAVLPWLQANHREPFFLWVHYFDPHHPHEPPAPYDQLYAHDPYLGEIAYSDESLGILLGHLRRLGVYERTLVVLTADHGEGRGEHRESTHSLLVYDSTLHVPLIVRVPDGSAGLRVEQRVGLVDVLPTVLDFLGLASPDGIQGQSLRPLIEGRSAGPSRRRSIYAETLSPRLTRQWGELRSLYRDGFKYIHGPRPELYRLDEDPRELRDLLAKEPDIASGLRRDLENYLAEHAVEELDSSVALDDEALRKLQALGYLHSSGDRVGPIEERLSEDGDPPQDHAHTISAYSHAKSLLFHDQPLEAREFLVDLLRDDENNAHYLELLANVELRLGNAEEALLLLERIGNESEGYPREKILTTSAGILLSQGRVDAAYARYREAEALGETAEGQYRLARIHSLRGEVQDQQRFLQRALELEPSFAPARLDLAVGLASRGELQQADEEFRRALAEHPYFTRLIFNYGAFLIQRERPQDALPFFRRAVLLRPDYLQAHYALVETLRRLDKLPEARNALEALEGLAPSSREAILAREVLEGRS